MSHMCGIIKIKPTAQNTLVYWLCQLLRIINWLTQSIHSIHVSPLLSKESSKLSLLIASYFYIVWDPLKKLHVSTDKTDNGRNIFQTNWNSIFNWGSEQGAMLTYSIVTTLVMLTIAAEIVSCHCDRMLRNWRKVSDLWSCVILFI